MASKETRKEKLKREISDLYYERTQFWRTADDHAETDKEIVSLRSQIAVMDRDAEDLLGSRNAWQRRAFDLYVAAQYPSVDIPSEAAKWFEEKEDAN